MLVHEGAQLVSMLPNTELNDINTARHRAIARQQNFDWLSPVHNLAMQNETNLAALDCPQKFYCPDPARKLTCPAGAYCVNRTVAPISCNYDKLLKNQPYALLPGEELSVVKRLRDRGDPYKGNFCPAGSVKPNSVCT